MSVSFNPNHAANQRVAFKGNNDDDGIGGVGLTTIGGVLGAGAGVGIAALREPKNAALPANLQGDTLNLTTLKAALAIEKGKDGALEGGAIRTGKQALKKLTKKEEIEKGLKDLTGDALTKATDAAKKLGNDAKALAVNGSKPFLKVGGWGAAIGAAAFLGYHLIFGGKEEAPAAEKLGTTGAMS